MSGSVGGWDAKMGKMDSLIVLYWVADSLPPMHSTPQLQPAKGRFKYKTAQYIGLQLLILFAILLGQIHSVLALQPGQRSVEVSQLQQTLQAIGYYHGPITGYYGILTQAAIRNFQAAHGLWVDGIAGPQTLRALDVSSDFSLRDWDLSISLHLGDSGPVVVELQQNLQVMGYYQGVITGYYGVVTQTAVKRFQAAMGLRLTGVVDRDTLASLEAEIYAGEVGHSPMLRSPSQSRGGIRRYWYP